MAIKFLAILMCVLPLAVSAADNAPKTTPNSNAAPAVRAMPPNQISGPSAEEAGKAIYELSGLLVEFDMIAQPLLEPNRPFALWINAKKNQIHKAFDAAKAAPTPMEILTQAKALKSEVNSAITIAQRMAKADPEAFKVVQAMAQTKACLEKRQTAFKKTYVVLFTANEQVLAGSPGNVTPANDFLAEAKTACP